MLFFPFTHLSCVHEGQEVVEGLAEVRVGGGQRTQIHLAGDAAEDALLMLRTDLVQGKKRENEEDSCYPPPSPQTHP